MAMARDGIMRSICSRNNNERQQYMEYCKIGSVKYPLCIINLIAYNNVYYIRRCQAVPIQ